MNILVLGGTGPMGTMLVKQLTIEYADSYIIITSRKERKSDNKKIRYVKGDAKDIEFLKGLMLDGYDVIVDFMIYSTAEFQERYEIFLSNTKQYVFISSARVYAQKDTPITEDSPRLLDVSDDEEYLKTDEYALAKARCEDLLNNSGKINFTIIRPSITYGVERLQLGVLEKENWLYRALNGRSIVFSNDIAQRYTAMTTGLDVAKGIVALIGKEKALGECFHITSERSYTWNEILQCYLKIFEEEIGVRPKVVYTDKAISIKTHKYQVIYSRYFDRRFDNSKIKEFVNVDRFTEPMCGLAECLREILRNPQFRDIDWRLEAWNDRASGERTSLKEISGLKTKIMYLLYRYNFDFIANFYLKLTRK